MECVEKKLVCVSCPMGCRLTVKVCGDEITVTGNTCKRGEVYGKNEVTDPRRMICSTARIQGGVHPVVPVKTDKPIPEKQVTGYSRRCGGCQHPGYRCEYCCHKKYVISEKLGELS